MESLYEIITGTKEPEYEPEPPKLGKYGLPEPQPEYDKITEQPKPDNYKVEK